MSSYEIWKALAKEAEQLHYGSRRLDGLIAGALNGKRPFYEMPLYYTSDLNAARSISSWLLTHASDIGADGLPLVELCNTFSPVKTVRGVGLSSQGSYGLIQAYVVAACLANAQDCLDADLPHK